MLGFAVKDSVAVLDFPNSEGFTEIYGGVWRKNKHCKVIYLPEGLYRRYDGCVYKDYSCLSDAILGK